MSSDARPATVFEVERPMVETSYGHLKRFNWLEQQLQPSDRVLEFGCGTGLMITLPLLRRGYDVWGIDLDEESIAYGREVLQRQGHDARRLLLGDLSAVTDTFDVIIASEVLEHLESEALERALTIFRGRLAPGGRLLVTVPNGYGSSELESLLWYRLGFGPLLKKLVRRAAIRRIAPDLGREPTKAMPAGSLAASPHLQRFTWRSVRRLLSAHGFRCESTAGSMLVGGPFSGLLLDRSDRLLQLSSRLGDRFPRLSIDYMLACRVGSP